MYPKGIAPRQRVAQRAHAGHRTFAVRDAPDGHSSTPVSRRAERALTCCAQPGYCPRARSGRFTDREGDMMNPTITGVIVLACTLAGTLAGMCLRSVLPSHHLTGESRDTMKLGIGLIATMTALVLGLVTASAKSSFDAVDAAIRHSAMELLTLDRLLARYGPETREIREGFRRSVGSRIEMVWPANSSRPTLDPSAEVSSGIETLADRIRGLKPRDESQQLLRARALELTETLLKDRWVVAAAGSTSVPLPFLVILLFWLTVTFASFGLLAPRNPTVIVVLLACALSVSSAIFLVLEMDGPFDGVLKVSPSPLRYAYERLGQ